MAAFFTRSARNVVLLLLFSAVLRPTECRHRSENVGQDMHHIGAHKNYTSSNQKQQFPLILLFTNFGSFVSSDNHKRRRRRQEWEKREQRKDGGQLFTLQYEFSHLVLQQRVTRAAPLYVLLCGLLKTKKVRSQPIFEFLGAGFYFAIIQLMTSNWEINPGPFGNEEKEFLENLFDRKLAPTNQSLEELKSTVAQLTEGLEEEKRRVEELANENSRLTEHVVALERRLAKQESLSRRQNLVVFGLPNDGNPHVLVSELLVNKMNYERRETHMIDEAWRIGKRDAAKRPIIVRFRSMTDKINVMRQVHLLKGSRIVLADDLDPEEQKERRKMVAASKEAQQHGLRANIRRKGLFIEGELVSHESISAPGWVEAFLQKRRQLLRQCHQENNDQEQQQQTDGLQELDRVTRSTRQNARETQIKPRIGEKRSQQQAALSPPNLQLESQAGSRRGFARRPDKGQARNSNNQNQQERLETTSLDRNSSRGKNSNIRIPEGSQD